MLLKAGDLDEARTAYQAARAPYKRLETVAYRFSDLVNRLNPSADYLAGREADLALTGFHRIAYGLYAKNSLDGLTPVADHLVADATDLQEKLRGPKLTPARSRPRASLATVPTTCLREDRVRGRMPIRRPISTTSPPIWKASARSSRN